MTVREPISESWEQLNEFPAPRLFWLFRLNKPLALAPSVQDSPAKRADGLKSPLWQHEEEQEQPSRGAAGDKKSPVKVITEARLTLRQVRGNWW